MRNNIPLLVLLSGNENCQEVRNLIKVIMRLEVVGNLRGVGGGRLLITDI